MTRENRPKLTPAKARWIRRKYAMGWTIRTLARMHDVPYTTIHDVVKGRTFPPAAKRPAARRPGRAPERPAPDGWGEAGDDDAGGAEAIPTPPAPVAAAIVPDDDPEADEFTPGPMHEEPARGEEHGLAKLTDPDVMEARRRRRLGLPLAGMARRLGVSANALRYAAKGKTWRHLPMVQIEATDSVSEERDIRLQRSCVWIDSSAKGSG